MKLKVFVHPAEEGGFWVEAPALPGCVSEGRLSTKPWRTFGKPRRVGWRWPPNEEPLGKTLKFWKSTCEIDVRATVLQGH
jgi:hypothetical protein